jgi:methyl-accepting chemotaxis protein
MRSVLSGADAIGRETAEITTAATDLSKRTENQAATLAEVSARVSSLAQTVRTTADNARSADTDVSRTRSDTEESARLVTRAVDAMNAIESSSQQIQSIIKVIDDIAFQTNLLALNAGVEAARAGEAGRGFAVVASEVRALAQRSSEAADEIKGLIESSGSHVGEGVDLVRKTGEALQTVTESVGRVSGRISEIAQAAEQQSASLGEIDTALGELDQVTQRNAAMFEQTTAASQSLARGAETLVGTIAVFVTGRSPAARPSGAEGARTAA